ncbi:hypothetical protein FLW53_39915 [Microbispora sp. SCL1-1]|uniref:hypothetical protein n=1 Tax=Microbispora TaxID=2005 RepID=UPI00115BE2C9|nr:MULTISPECIES: hypothetical protein [unclassified Microbispora]NJP30257.1 hypothetical protein [Microbispora sp. CL1-1]TQS02236.1 hypothetical protein FLW53_39915 [Microbispora sp. SCL1-1]
MDMPATGLLAYPAVIVIGTTLVLGVFCGVVLPAVWSRQAARRRAAYTVMDRILKFMRPRS